LRPVGASPLRLEIMLELKELEELEESGDSV
jgi:hypothetical protein